MTTLPSITATAHLRADNKLTDDAMQPESSPTPLSRRLRRSPARPFRPRRNYAMIDPSPRRDRTRSTFVKQIRWPPRNRRTCAGPPLRASSAPSATPTSPGSIPSPSQGLSGSSDDPILASIIAPTGRRWSTSSHITVGWTIRRPRTKRSLESRQQTVGPLHRSDAEGFSPRPVIRSGVAADPKLRVLFVHHWMTISQVPFMEARSSPSTKCTAEGRPHSRRGHEYPRRPHVLRAASSPALPPRSGAEQMVRRLSKTVACCDRLTARSRVLAPR